MKKMIIVAEIGTMKKACLDKTDIISEREVLDRFTRVRDKDEAVNLAKLILNLDEHNDRAETNERNIALVYDYLQDNCRKGDVLCETEVMKDFHKDTTFWTTNVKTRAALKRLCEEGFMRKTRARVKNEGEEDWEARWRVVYICE